MRFGRTKTLTASILTVGLRVGLCVAGRGMQEAGQDSDHQTGFNENEKIDYTCQRRI